MADNNKATSLDNVKQYVKGVLQGWIPNKSTLDALSTGTNGDLLYNGQPIGSGDPITVDAVLSSVSENPVQNKVIYDALQNISGSGTIISVDTVLSDTSENPVQNKVIKSALDNKANASDIPDVSGFVTQSALTAKQDVLTFDSFPTANSINPVTSGGVYTAIQNIPIATPITVDTTLNATSENPVQNKAIYSALQNISGGTPAIVDAVLDLTSENPVQNKVIKEALDKKADISSIPDVSGFALTSDIPDISGKQDKLTFDLTPTKNSSNPVTSDGIYNALQNAGTGIGCDDTPMSQINQMLIDIFGDDNQSGVKIVSFASGTDQELADMLAAHYAGDIDIHDYWSVGDTRTVSLSAMDATYVGESHASQSVEIVLVNSGGYMTSDNKECAFVWQQKDGLAEPGYMNPTATNSGSWTGSARKAWCSSVYKEALPTGFKDLLKECTVKTAEPNQTGVLYDETQEDIFLASMTEINGTIIDSTTNNNLTWPDGYEGNQWDYYKTETNRHNKKMGTIASDTSTRLFYWLRSPDRASGTSFMRNPSWTNPTRPKGSQADSASVTTTAYTYYYMIVPCGFI